MFLFDGLGLGLGGVGDNELEERERVGFLILNGYDDISFIIRGEWGFLFFVVVER